MSSRICAVQIQLTRHVLGHSQRTAPTRQHDLFVHYAVPHRIQYHPATWDTRTLRRSYRIHICRSCRPHGHTNHKQITQHHTDQGYACSMCTSFEARWWSSHEPTKRWLRGFPIFRCDNSGIHFSCKLGRLPTYIPSTRVRVCFVARPFHTLAELASFLTCGPFSIPTVVMGGGRSACCDPGCELWREGAGGINAQPWQIRQIIDSHLMM